MAELVNTRVTEIYRTRCPHCRPTVEHPKGGILVTIEKDNKGQIIDLKVNCEVADANRGQDRT